MVDLSKEPTKKFSKAPIAGPNWDRPIWVAAYDYVSIPAFGSKFKKGSTISWSIEPYLKEAFEEVANPDDPIVVIGTSKAEHYGIIMIGKISELMSGPRDNPHIRIIVTKSHFHNPIKEHVVTNAFPELQNSRSFPTSLQKLSQSESDELHKIIEDAEKSSSVEAKQAQNTTTPTPPPDPRTTKSHFNTDRPRSVKDTLHRAPNAFVIAQYLNRLRGKPSPDSPSQDSYVLHVDAPWGGGKTTFANFIANFLSFKRYKTTAEEIALADQTAFIKDSGVEADQLNDISANGWMILRFNAWENQHVTPPWWNFYTSFLNGYKQQTHLHEGLQLSEYIWRFFTPETKKSLTITAVLILFAFGIVQYSETLQSYATSTAVAAVFGATSLAAFIFTQAKAGVRRLVDASQSAYNPTVLGEEDPLSRLRARFLRVAAYNKRPVLMIIDDIDRCEPEYVVELMRGLITIFQSNHVSYLILGDRGWIEQSFQNVNEDMADAHTDTTVSFGARFAEKVIQMSYLLPEIPEAERKLYLRSLLGTEAPKALLNNPTRELDAPTDTPITTQAAEAEAKEEQDHREAVALRTQKAIERSTDEDLEQHIQHQLEDLLHVLPENPRRVKRLVNMIAVYQGSGETTLGIDPDNAEQWLPMVLWLILFSEHPTVLRNIYKKPHLLDPLPDQPKDAEKPLLKYDWAIEGGMSRNARKVIDGIKLGDTQISITKPIAEQMRNLTPLA